MVLALAAGAANLVGGRIAATTGAVRFLPWAGLAVAGAAGLLWMVASPVRPTDEATSADAGGAVTTD